MPNDMSDKVAFLYGIACKLAREDVSFSEIKGPGHGDRASRNYHERVRKAFQAETNTGISELRIQGTSLAVDYYLPDEKTVVEIALGLKYPNSEFEKDIFKAALLKEAGYPVERLVLLCKPGGKNRCQADGRCRMIGLAKRKFEIDVDVLEII